MLLAFKQYREFLLIALFKIDNRHDNISDLGRYWWTPTIPSPYLSLRQHAIVYSWIWNSTKPINKSVIVKNWLVMMSDIEPEGEYDSEIYDEHQDRPTQDTPPGGSPVRHTRAKSYSRGTRKGKDKGRGKDSECSEDEQATLPRIKKQISPLSPLIVSMNTLDCAWRRKQPPVA